MMHKLLATLTAFTIAPATQAEHKNANEYPSTTVRAYIKSTLSLQETFEYIVPMDLEHIFHAYKNIPGIDSTSNQEAWYAPGMHRTVFFDDGTTSREYLLTLDAHSSFTYKVNEFTNPMKHLLKEIKGSWKFQEMPNGGLYIEWTYEFVPKHILARFLINSVVKKRMQTPMTTALNILKNELESGKLYQYKRRVGNW